MRCIIICLTILFLNSCGSSVEIESGTNNSLNEAWQLFEERKFLSAIELFQTVIEKSDDINAYVGAAYSYMFLNDYFNSTLILNQAVTLKTINADVLAALVFVLNAEGYDISSSNQFAEQLLSLKPDWSFGHQLNLTVTDIYLVQAQNYYILANFESSLDKLKLIDSTITIDINTEVGIIELGTVIESLNPGL